MGLPGSKNACEQGECGSCTVYLDGVPVCSCLVAAGQADGRDIVTVEGLAGGDGSLHPVQQAFIEAGAVQCGFCTPGLLVAAHDLLARDPDPADADVREALAGNLCRCTGYEKILEAVRLAAARLAAARRRRPAAADQPPRLARTSRRGVWRGGPPRGLRGEAAAGSTRGRTRDAVRAQRVSRRDHGRPAGRARQRLRGREREPDRGRRSRRDPRGLRPRRRSSTPPDAWPPRAWSTPTITSTSGRPGDGPSTRRCFSG